MGYLLFQIMLNYNYNFQLNSITTISLLKIYSNHKLKLSVTRVHITAAELYLPIIVRLWRTKVILPIQQICLLSKFNCHRWASSSTLPKSFVNSQSTVLGILPDSLCSSFIISWILIVCQSTVKVKWWLLKGIKVLLLHSAAGHWVGIMYFPSGRRIAWKVQAALKYQTRH